MQKYLSAVLFSVVFLMFALFVWPVSVMGSPHIPEQFWTGVQGSMIFGLLGIFLLLFSFKMFDWVTPNLDFEQKLGEGNIAVAIVIGSFLLGVAYICAHVVK